MTRNDTLDKHIHVIVSTMTFVVALGCIEEIGRDKQKDSVAISTQALTLLPGTPDNNCYVATYDSHNYIVCWSIRNWESARDRCRSVPGFDLIKIDSAAENAYVTTHFQSFTSVWIGANDRNFESSWAWSADNEIFWSGYSFWTGGHSVSGRYSNWSFWEPVFDLGFLDCGIIRPGLAGTWQTTTCLEWTAPYICEQFDMCPNDPDKTTPGQCGCGVPDTDRDNDGIADCTDLCPDDPNNTDSDGDGTPDCRDQCPNDRTKIWSGDCGCANAPKPAGTECDDGLCVANSECNGNGYCGDPLQCTKPDADCTFHQLGGAPYWFCNNPRSFGNAQQRCRSVAMDISIVESSIEDSFLKDYAADQSYLGGSDQVTEGEWYWQSTGIKFWTGGTSGSSVNDVYTNWASGQPYDFWGTNDCMVKNHSDGMWTTSNCASQKPYVCEGVPAPGPDLQSCVEAIRPREDLQGVAQEKAYQQDIARRCATPGESNCLIDLRTRVGFDGRTAALRLMGGVLSPAQFLAIERDRHQKARRFETDSNFASTLCSGLDSDDDLIPDPLDQCPGTPELVPTDDVGCEDLNLPPAPSAEDVNFALEKMGLIFNAACRGAPVLPISSPGPFVRNPGNELGVFLFATRVSNQPDGCPVWYHFDIQEFDTNPSNPSGIELVGRRYQLAFMDKEEDEDFFHKSLPVPTGFIQFNVKPTDPEPRSFLGTIPLEHPVRFRVRVMNGAGMRSGWSAWKIQSLSDCRVLGIDCGF